MKERLFNTGIKQSLIVRLTGIHHSTLSQYFNLDRSIKKEHLILIEKVLTHYEKALKTIEL